MKQIIYIGALLMVLVSCKKGTTTKTTEDNPEAIQAIIANLDTNEKKEAFLVELYHIDQGNRGEKKGFEELEILKKHNYSKQSQEYIDFMFNTMKVDSINTAKAIAYLHAYGYPEFEVKNNEARYAFQAILMHQPTYEKQLELFPYIHKAYMDEYIGADDFSFLLNNMHRHLQGKSHPHARTNEENIRQLLAILPLN